MTPAARFPLLLAASALATAQSFEQSQTFLRLYCAKCHEGTSPAAGFHLRSVAEPTSLKDNARKWTSLALRVRNVEMPPKNSPIPPLDERERFIGWVDHAVRVEACAAGPRGGPSPAHRLNRDEYAATIRDLFDMHLDIGQRLPADGAGGEGFDNAAETLFLSPLHAEKYLETAKLLADFAAREFKPRQRILVAKPGPGVTPTEAARRILDTFLPRAFRRPVPAAEAAPYLALYESARKQGLAFEPSVFFAIRAALVSPHFLFRVEPPNTTGAPRPLDQYALASRLSYFLWGSMPDELLLDVAASGQLQDPEVLRTMVGRMLRHDRSLNFAQRFIEQWLHTRELGGEKAPDAKLFPTYATDEELRADIRFQPILFFREVLVRGLPLTELIDSKYTIGTSNLTKHYGLTNLPLDKTRLKQPQLVEMPPGTNRGGLLGMAAVLAVSSHPYRTSPVLRGAWILDSMLGTPPPPPPANVPPLEDAMEPSSAKSMRERLEQHRLNPVCASCHSRIDPLGFALENYDAIGRWRDQDGGKPIDAAGTLIDGTAFNGPAELKKALFDRKDLFVRNITGRMLGYALGRGLSLTDSCAVDDIVAKVKENDYSSKAWIEAIVLSAPFREQAPAAVPARTSKERTKQ